MTYDNDGMSEEQAEAVSEIIKLFLELPWQDRASVFSAVRYNDIFCCECGYGSVEDPNENCQCWNDE